MRLISLVLFSIIVVGCGERLDGHRLMNFLVWMGEHPILAGAIFTVLTPFIAMIPVVGVPFAAVWAKVGTALIPALKQIAEAREAEEATKRKDMPDRTIKELGEIVVNDLRNDPSNPIGKVPGAGMIARIAARRLGKKARNRRKLK